MDPDEVADVPWFPVQSPSCDVLELNIFRGCVTQWLLVLFLLDRKSVV